VNYGGCQGNGVTFNAGNVLGLAMTSRRHQGMEIWHIFAQRVHNQVSISLMIGKMTQTSKIIHKVVRMMKTDCSADGFIAVP
jgi:hypothetical protein